MTMNQPTAPGLLTAPRADYVTDPLDPADPGLIGIGSQEYPLAAGDQLTIALTLVRLQTATLPDGRQVAPASTGGGTYHVYDQRRGVWVERSVDDLHLMLILLFERGLYYWKAGKGDEPPTAKRWASAAGALKAIATSAAVRMQAPPDHPLRHPAVGLACASGFVRATSRGVTRAAHSPDHGATWYIDAELRPWSVVQASEAYSMSLHRRFFYGDEEAPGVWAAHPDRDHLVRLIHQVFYVGLTGQGPRFHRMLLLMGEKGTGKSQVCEIAMGLLAGGRNGIGAIPPHLFKDDRYGAGLQGLALNVVTELPPEPIQMPHVKAVVSGENITRRAMYESPVTFACRAQHIFAGNHYPVIKGDEQAVWDRWLILRWEAPEVRDTRHDIPRIGCKIGGHGNVTESLDPDTGFLEVAPDPDADRAAREVLLSAVMWAGVELERAGRFELPQMHHDEVLRWQCEGDPIRTWLSDCAEVLPAGEPANAGERIGDLYESYKVWCRASTIAPVSRLDFKRQLLGLTGALDRDGNPAAITEARSAGTRLSVSLRRAAD